MRPAKPERGVLRLLAPFSPERRTVEVLELSRHAAKLQLVEAIDAGTLVQIRLSGTILLAVVADCRSAEASFHLDIRIQDVHPY